MPPSKGSLTFRKYGHASHEITMSGLDEARYQFGLVLHKILFQKINKRGKTINQQIDAREVEDRLGIPAQHLKLILYGRFAITSAMASKLPGKLKKYYPETWARYEGDYNAAFLALKKYSKYPNDEPFNDESLGHVVWSIIGGKNSDINEAAENTGIPPETLYYLIHGQRAVQKTLIRIGLRDKLEEAYPRTFRRLAGIFDERFKELPKNGATVCSEGDKAEFCNLVKLIIGDESNLVEAAEILGVSYGFLLGVVRGKHVVSQDTLLRKNWAGKFKIHYSTTWNAYFKYFFKYAARMPMHEKGIPREFQDKEKLGFRFCWPTNTLT